MKLNSELCKRMAFTIIVMAHLLMAIAVYQCLLGPIRVVTWLGWFLIVLIIISDALVDFPAKCKHHGCPQKKPKDRGILNGTYV
jgi:hypothetical protein